MRTEDSVLFNLSVLSPRYSVLIISPQSFLVGYGGSVVSRRSSTWPPVVK